MNKLKRSHHHQQLWGKYKLTDLNGGPYGKKRQCTQVRVNNENINGDEYMVTPKKKRGNM